MKSFKISGAVCPNKSREGREFLKKMTGGAAYWDLEVVKTWTELLKITS